MKNITSRSNFRLDLPDDDQTKSFVWQVQQFEAPSVNLETAQVVRSPKIAGTQIAGTGTSYEDIQITFLLDADMATYTEIYKWMMSMNNPVGATTWNWDNCPRAGLLHILDNTKENVVLSFKFHEMYPKALTSIEWNYTEAAEVESVTCTATFGYLYFDLIDADKNVVGPRPM